MLEFIKKRVVVVTDFLSHLLQEARAKGTRSSALQSLLWALSILGVTLIGAIRVEASFWIVVILACAFAILFLTFIASFVFLLLRDRDCLRSESFSLSKLAIERGLMGDNLIGLIEAPPEGGTLIDAGAIENEDKDEDKDDDEEVRE